MRVLVLGLSILLLSTPAFAWRVRVSGTPDPGRVNAIATTSAGDVVAAGRFGTAAAGDDGVAVKLGSADGAEAWRAVIAGSANGNDILRDVLVMSGGDVVVLGQVANTNLGNDGVVARLVGTTGSTMSPGWRVDLDGGSAGADTVREGALFGDDVIAVGSSTRTDAKGPFTVWRLAAADGAIVWHSHIDGAGGVARIVATAADAIYVAGHMTGAAGTDIVVARLDSATGDVGWHVVLAGSGHTGDTVEAIALAGTRIVVAGELNGTTTSPDVVIVALDAATGAESWRVALDGTAADANDTDGVLGLAVAPDGGVVAAGSLANTGMATDAFVTKRGPVDGHELWTTQIDGPAHRTDDARALAIDADGDVVIAGRIRSATNDFATVKLDGATGLELWRDLFDGQTGAADQALAVAIDPSGHVAAGGFTNNGAGADELTVVKLAGATGGSFPCGDGHQDAGEACDDANLALGDGCRPNCTAEICGDGIRDPQEACDGGPDAPNDCCTASCESVGDGLPCDDGNACTTQDVCQSGTCTGGDPIVCPPTNAPCEESACNATTGQCRNRPQAGGSACDDGNACTADDYCVGTQCIGGGAPACDDADPCTDDGCEPAQGCTHVTRAGVPSATCVFERPTIDASCTSGIPAPVRKLLGQAESRLRSAETATKPAKRTRLLKAARSAAMQAQRMAEKRVRRGSLPPECGNAVASTMTDLRSRIDDLL